MSLINKGTVSSVDGTTARIQPSINGGITMPLTIPARLRDVIKKKNEVVYVLFEDGTGIIIDRIDGEEVIN
ncbi:MAG: hypothetical protein PHX08_11690 [Lachnospiraceae bacterium]|nr:hypothetical protein [Lachnospiraceae bacterium]